MQYHAYKLSAFISAKEPSLYGKNGFIALFHLSKLKHIIVWKMLIKTVIKLR